MAGLLFCAGAKAQTMPSFYSQDPGYWYGQYLTQRSKADSLSKFGTTAINGLQASLDTANNRISKQAAIQQKSDDLLTDLKDELDDEFIRGRFLGWGRRAFIKGLLKKLQSK
jgi:hypothetical protein